MMINNIYGSVVEEYYQEALSSNVSVNELKHQENVVLKEKIRW
jgi:hypothetical protein